EVQMYLFLPLLYLFCRVRSGLWALAIWCASIPIAIVQINLSGRLNVLEYAPCFLGGVVAWRLVRQFQTRSLPAWLWPIAMAACAPVWMLAPQEHARLQRWLFCLILGAAIPWFKEISWKFLTRAAHLIAKYSYGIYLSHPGVLFWGHGLRAHDPRVPPA